MLCRVYVNARAKSINIKQNLQTELTCLNFDFRVSFYTSGLENNKKRSATKNKFSILTHNIKTCHKAKSFVCISFFFNSLKAIGNQVNHTHH